MESLIYHCRAKQGKKSVYDFFKQKTAYEILRSDWSSDVCSSDLEGRCAGLGSTGLALGGATFRDAQLGEESG